MDENHETASIVVGGTGYSYYIVNGDTTKISPELTGLRGAGAYTLTFYNIRIRVLAPGIYLIHVVSEGEVKLFRVRVGY